MNQFPCIRTLELAKKRAPGHVACAKKELVYYTIHYACVFGSEKKYQKKGMHCMGRDLIKGSYIDTVIRTEQPCHY